MHRLLCARAPPASPLLVLRSPSCLRLPIPQSQRDGSRVHVRDETDREAKAEAEAESPSGAALATHVARADSSHRYASTTCGSPWMCSSVRALDAHLCQGVLDDPLIRARAAHRRRNAARIVVGDFELSSTDLLHSPTGITRPPPQDPRRRCVRPTRPCSRAIHRIGGGHPWPCAAH